MAQPATCLAPRRGNGPPWWLSASLLLAALLAGGGRSAAEDPAAPTWVENPEYLAWSAFAPGAWVSHEARFAVPSVIPGKLSTGVRTWTERLVKVEEEVLIVALQTSTHRDARTGTVSSPVTHREIAHWVREQSWPEGYPERAQPKVTLRDETLTVLGKSIDCVREDTGGGGQEPPAPGAAPRRRAGQVHTESSWRAPSLPGGLVQVDVKHVKLLPDGSEEVVHSIQIRLTGWGVK